MSFPFSAIVAKLACFEMSWGYLQSALCQNGITDFRKLKRRNSFQLSRFIFHNSHRLSTPNHMPTFSFPISPLWRDTPPGHPVTVSDHTRLILCTSCGFRYANSQYFGREIAYEEMRKMSKETGRSDGTRMTRITRIGTECWDC